MDPKIFGGLDIHSHFSIWKNKMIIMLPTPSFNKSEKVLGLSLFTRDFWEWYVAVRVKDTEQVAELPEPGRGNEDDGGVEWNNVAATVGK